MNSPSRTSAFTLIEILVVVAIVGCLATLMIPVISSARAQAASTRCVGNLRKLGQVVQQYAGENNGAISGSVAELAPYLGEEYNYAQKKWPTNSQSVFVCPVRKAAASNGWFASPMYLGSLVVDRSYGPNHHITGTDETKTDLSARRVRMNEVKASKTMIFMDCTQTVGVWSPSISMTFPHKEHVNTLFLDGHIDSLDRDRMTFLAAHIRHVFWRGYDWGDPSTYSEE
jgi:prepilin-type N-terminal cleavage/methylation domain-containing protein/prepilin-type processing-associated H-X9-DG protein